MCLKQTLFIILFITILSCQNDNKESYSKVTFYDYQIWISDKDRVDLRDSLAGYTTKVKENESTYVELKFLFDNPNKSFYKIKPGDITYASFDFEIKNDVIFIDGIGCDLVDTVSIDYRGKPVELFVSKYDRKNSCDEESLIYWNNQMGLIAQYNYHMGALILFEYEKFKDFSKVCFYNYIVKEEKEKR
jgi:hypothetical protein